MDAHVAVMELHKLFKANEWIQKDRNNSVYECISNICVLLEPEERELMLELIERYTWITQVDYQDRFIESMQSINEDQLKGVSTIYFFPILNPKDEGKTKSGHTVIYMVKSYHHLMSKYSGVKFKIIDSFDEMLKLDIKEDERVFLVDDYIGSGLTLESCMLKLGANLTLRKEHLKVVCIAIQEQTLFELVSEYAILKALTVKRGITDHNTAPFIESKKELMRNIEKHVPGAKSYSLGLNETEALITLMRTPDNTFPVFWKRFKKNGKYVDAPFPREEDNE